ncbi:AfsR/SARP family transcriptional regulator [Streptomyces sp. SPB162]|uniref:AfsR/SARP family transcriptional regulator n=1 Tax=Streptomyces sp. SPB162 TaxID=2940560 RepID=UPI0024057F98|nr:AfsR/SARP family transcriptional regulator [Streptomyces sp. SPB162]MDF9815639.1 DNA-binding SARP family transcriptional activator [Streptomyces sp. SPB162]
MRFWILGPMEIGGSDGSQAGPDGAATPAVSYTPRAAKLRVVLAALLVRANEVVSVESLIDELWQDNPPRTATTTLQVYVSQLRKLLHSADPEHGRDTLLTRPPGYLLRLEPGRLDMTTFEELHARGRKALEAEDYVSAAELQQRAIAMWRGPLLSDTPHGPLLGGAAVRLTEARMTALDQRVRADLQLGRHRGLVAELQSLASEHPLREEFHAHLMVALYRTGRQAEALRTFGRVRRTLVDELAIEPGPRLQRLHRRILAGDAALLSAGGNGGGAGSGSGSGSGSAVAEAPAHAAPERAFGTEFHAVTSLPAADGSFTGRDTVLAEVGRLLRDAPAGTSVAITGKPGVGKTALAVEAAHHSADAFPDGRIFLDLEPDPGRPLGAADALTRLLRRAGTQVVLPAEAQDLQDALRDLLTDRRILLVLDNATSEAQLRPLLPATAGSTALITGRRLPAGLGGVRPVVLDALDPAESLLLFDALAGPGSAAAEPAAAAEIVELCGHLPLAVHIAAAQLRTRPHWTAGSLAARLRDERSRLTELRLGDLDVRGTLMVAYLDSSPAAQRAFRLLGLLPAGPFGLWAAAAVLGLEEGEAGRVVEHLVDGRLLEASVHDGPRQGRYHFHPLLRILATELLAAEETPESARAATERMCDAYTRAAERADAALTPRPVTGPVGVPGPVTDHPQEWFAREQPALVHAVGAAHAAGLWSAALRLVDAMTGYLEAHASWADWRSTHTLALDAARRGGDRPGEARMLRSLGDLAWQNRRLAEATDLYTRARDTALRCDDADEFGRALVGLADLHLDDGDTSAAAALLEPALAALAAPARARGRYDALRALALLAWEAEGPEAARARFTQCLDLATSLKDRRLEAYARRALRALRDPAPASGHPTDLEVRPGIWRLRAPAPRRTSLPAAGRLTALTA